MCDLSGWPLGGFGPSVRSVRTSKDFCEGSMGLACEWYDVSIAKKGAMLPRFFSFVKGSFALGGDF